MSIFYWLNCQNFRQIQFMGKIGSGKNQVGIVLAKPLVDKLSTRATAIDLTLSRYAAMIIETWERQGCAPVSEPDRLMQISKLAYEAKKTGPEKANTHP